MVAAVERPVLSLADLEAFDPDAPAGGRERRFCCPLPACGDKPRSTAHRSLSVNVETGAWTCYRCQADGKLRERWERRTRDQQRRVAAQRILAVPPEPAPAPVDQWWPAGAELKPAANSPAASLYLARRGIPRALATAADVAYALDWYGRPAVCFPVRDRAGALVALHGRYVDGGEHPKARTAGDLRLGVFATPEALTATRLVLCEGPLDALSLALAGIPAVALCGVALPEWAPTVAAFRTVALAYDADAGGDAAAEKHAPLFRAFGATVERWRPDGGKDWNELLTTRGQGALPRGT